MKQKTDLKNLDLSNKRIFLRADLNVPFKDNNVIDYYRLKAIIPTIDFIQKNNGKVILATHLGRPKNHDPKFSTKIIKDWLTKNGYKVDLEENLDKAQEKSKKDFDTILLLENLRFFPGEKNQDADFAKQLAKLADIYINDAFGLLHRNDTSITLLPKQFSKDKKAIGFLIEKELKALEKLDNPKHPYMLIIGGGKVTDKLPIIDCLLDKINILALCPAVVFTFLKALGKNVGKSLVDDNLLSTAKKILEKAKEKNVEVLFPLDYIVAKDTFKGPISILNKDEITGDYVGITIGPKTEKLYAQKIMHAKTIFYNGLSGSASRKETLTGVNAIFKAMENSNAFTLIGGGDSAAAASILNIQNNIDHVSTGGGVILSYLCNKELPGLKYM